MAQLEAVREAVQTHIAGVRFTSRSEAEAWFGGLGELMRDMGQGFAHAASAMEEVHIHSAVRDAVRELGQVVGGTAGTADDVFASHCRAHEMWRND